MADDNTRGTYDQVLVDIVAYVYHYDSYGTKAWQHSRAVLFDALGCALETLRFSSESKAFIGPVVPGTVVPNGMKLPGTSFQLDPVKGAFDLGSLIRYLDHNDAYPGAEWGHPSDNIGAILSVSDWISRTSMSRGEPPINMNTVLIALMKAYEIQGCLQMRNAFNKVGLDHTLLVKIASTAVVSWLLGLLEDQTLDALSQAWIDAGPLRVFRQSPNTGPRKGWAAGDACMRAVYLALLTKHGQPGAPTALTAPRWGFFATLFKGKAFEIPSPYTSSVIENIFFKIHPIEGHAVSAVEAALSVSQELKHRNLSVEKDIGHIRVRTQEAAMIIINKRGQLHNAADRDHCMQYMVAVTLLKGSMMEAQDYLDNSIWAQDLRVDELREKIELEESEQFTRDYHDMTKRTASNALQVQLSDGTFMDEITVDYPLGHPWREDTLEAVNAKFESNVRGWLEQYGKHRDVFRIAALDDSAFRKMSVPSFIDAFTFEPRYL